MKPQSIIGYEYQVAELQKACRDGNMSWYGNRMELIQEDDNLIQHVISYDFKMNLIDYYSYDMYEDRVFNERRVRLCVPATVIMSIVFGYGDVA